MNAVYRSARRPGRGLHRFRPASTDDSGIAMVTTLIAIMLTAMLSILLLGVVMSEMLPTAFLRTSSRTVFAAEAGVNAVVGQIRTAASAPDVTGAVYGDNAKLPCTAEGPVDGAGTTLTYEVQAQYFIEDPTGRTASWIAAHAISCVPGSGPAADPGYALVTSTGVGDGVAGLAADAGDRTVSVVYEFQVTNNNIPGGLVYSFDETPSLSNRFCLEAYSATVGSNVKYIPAVDCGSNDILQLWIYDTDYQLKLASTTVPSVGVDPLCITGPVGASLPQRVTLQVCKADTDAARWNQLFSWEGGARWRGQKNPISGGYSDVLLSSGTASGSPAGRDLYVGTSAADKREWGSFNPDPRVGPGAAGPSTHQIVNYLEFGRCTDVTGGVVGSTFMIVYPCKQDPSGGGALAWNHKWYYTEPAGDVGTEGPQQIYILRNNSTSEKYCLVSPGTEGGYAVLTSACSTTAANQKWIRSANLGDYAPSYTFVDNWGRCMSLGDKYDGAWSKITTATCNFGLGQKWNSPPNTITASLDGYQEIP